VIVKHESEGNHTITKETTIKKATSPSTHQETL
jgi:hypothetical protein